MLRDRGLESKGEADERPTYVSQVPGGGGRGVDGAFRQPLRPGAHQQAQRPWRRDRRAPPFRSARPERRPAPLVAAGIARPDGEVRHRRRHPVDDAERRPALQRHREGAHRDPARQRLRRRAGAEVPEAVRPDGRRAATRPRRLPQGDRVRLRHAEGGRHRHLQQRQPGALAGRPVLRADVAGTEPPQRHRLHAPAGAHRVAAT